jgi:hypothetical protein
MESLLTDIQNGRLADTFGDQVARFQNLNLTNFAGQANRVAETASTLRNQWQEFDQQARQALHDFEIRTNFAERVNKRFGSNLKAENLSKTDAERLESLYGKLEQTIQARDRLQKRADMTRRKFANLNSSLRNLNKAAKTATDPKTRKLIRKAVRTARQQQTKVLRELGDTMKPLENFENVTRKFVNRRFRNEAEINNVLDQWTRYVNAGEKTLADAPFPSLAELGLPKPVLQTIVADEWARQLPNAQPLVSAEIADPEMVLGALTERQDQLDRIGAMRQRLGQFKVRLGDAEQKQQVASLQNEWLSISHSAGADSKAQLEALDTTNMRDQLIDSEVELDRLQGRLNNIQNLDQLRDTVAVTQNDLDAISLDESEQKMQDVETQLQELNSTLDREFKQQGYKEPKDVVINRSDEQFAEFFATRYSEAELEKLGEKLGVDMKATVRELNEMKSGQRSKLGSRAAIRRFQQRFKEEMPEAAFKEFQSCFANPGQPSCSRTAAGPLVLAAGVGTGVGLGSLGVGIGLWATMGSGGVFGIGQFLSVLGSSVSTGTGAGAGTYGFLATYAPTFNIAEFYLEIGANAVTQGETVVPELYNLMGAGANLNGFSMVRSAVSIGYNIVPWDLLLLGDGELRKGYRRATGQEVFNPIFTN